MLGRGISRILVGSVGAVLCLGYVNCAPSFEPSQMSLSSASSALDLRAQGKVLYDTNCSGCHGPVEASTKRSRDVDLINWAIGNVPQMSYLGSLTQNQREAISAALAPQDITPPVMNSRGQQIFACTPGQVAKTPMLKLTNREYRSALNMLLDDFSVDLKNDAELLQRFSTLPSDIVTESRNTLKEQSLLVAGPIVSGAFEAGFRAGFLITTAATGLQNYPNTNSCLSASAITQSCHQLFVRELGSRGFRKRLGQSEGDALALKLWDATLTKNELIQATFASIVSMPDFFYQIYDRGNALSSQVLQLTAHELASKTAFFLTGAPPDAALRAKADSGDILNATVLSQEVDRLLALPSARQTMLRLFRESYGYDYYDSFLYDAAFVSGINTSGLQEVMNRELDEYFANVVIDRRGSFFELMTSTSTNVSDSRLASIYGVANGATNLSQERAGFLNRAAFLTKRSGFRASPIKRGLKVLEHVLCEEVGLPPVDAPTSLPPSVEGMYVSTRDQTQTVSEAAGTSCVQCHSKINNLGYPFERFDSFGRLRNAEAIYNGSGQVVASLAINTRSTSLQIRSPYAVNVQDSTELGAELGRSEKAMMCFVRHLKRFQARVPASSESNCEMNAPIQVMYGTTGPQGSVADAIKALILTPEFKRWSY